MIKAEREALRRAYGCRCGYCGVREEETGAELTVDHYQPLSRGGAEEWDNWVYACFAYNINKGDHWQPGTPQRILHPLRNCLTEHVQEQPDGTLVGLTETGRFHIEKLQLNRPPLILCRLARRQQERIRQALSDTLQTQESMQQRIDELEQALQRAEERLRILKGE